ncbi:MAG: putative peptidoglycan glycosyltransferase FtsW [Eubacteriales bacterium]
MARSKRDLNISQQLAYGPIDVPFFMLTMLLLGIGLVMMFSASYATAYYDSSADGATFYIEKQLRFAFVGLVVMFFISKFNYQHYRQLAFPAVVFSIILLILVVGPFGLGFGEAEVGSQRWLKIGSFNFQPSEIAKVTVIVYFAARLSTRGTEKGKLYSKRTFMGSFLNKLQKAGYLELGPYVLVLGIIVFLMLKQPHMSGTILILVGAASVMFAAGIQMKFFLLACAAAAGGLGFFVMYKADYMRSRVQLWLDPWSDPQDKGFQIIQSLYAIGSGGLTGLGLGQSRQKYLYIPEPENDFVFPIVVEELGFIGALVIIILYMLLILRGYWLALHSRDRFGALLIVGNITLLAVQVFLNIGVVTNFIPTTGISLPFFSYGGTALMIQLAQMGMILAVSRQISPVRQD